MKNNVIKTAFKMPEDYNRTFMLETENTQTWIVADGSHGGLQMCSRGKGGAREQSRTLDWVQEVVEFIRAECEQGRAL